MTCPSGSCRRRSSVHPRHPTTTRSGTWSALPHVRSEWPPSRIWVTTSGCPGPTPSGGWPSWWPRASWNRSRSPAGPPPAYLWPAARRPRAIRARALLSPFDPLIWFRERTERLFGFRYRIEIYTPPGKRVHGYYVLPFLLGESLVARVDLKSDRQAGALLVQSAFAEPGVDRDRVAAELAAELKVTARWLDLDAVVVADRGDLAAELTSALRSADSEVAG